MTEAGSQPGSRICGFADRQSVGAGETIRFFVSDLNARESANRTIRIVRLGLHAVECHAGAAIVHPDAAVPSQAWQSCDWPLSFALVVGERWRSGVYVARLGAEANDLSDVYFVVRPSGVQPKAAIVVQIPTTTINAYCNWGGRSLYAYNSKPEAAHAVSFDRPQQTDPAWPRGYGFAQEWNQRIAPFVRWLEAAGIEADFITNNDLHREDDLLAPYRLFVSIGHDEYWTRAMRDRFDAFIASGGNAAILSGNTCYWRIRLEQDGRTKEPGRVQVCHRLADRDPVADPVLATVTWREAGRPENASFGAGFAFGAWRGAGDLGGFTIHRADHWVFAGTGLCNGDRLGDASDEPILGYETDGVAYALDGQGRPVPTGEDGTPPGYEILALAELPEWGDPGNAAMGILTHPAPGGVVFNAATTDWSRGLTRCLADGALLKTATAQITWNVIQRLGGAPPPPTQPA